MYYNICEYCGAYLDSGERCDCKESMKLRQKKKHSASENRKAYKVLS
jgi:hypothetical protein